MEPTLETREIRGVTWKLMYTILATAITISVIGFGAYKNILDAIKDSSTANAIQDMRLRNLEISIEKTQIEIEEIKKNIANRQ